MAVLKRSRSSAVEMASALAPISSTPKASRTPRSDRAMARLSPVWPPRVGKHGVGPLALDDGRQHVGVEGLDVGPVGQLGVGHDRGRVGVDQHDPVSLGPQHPAGLGARVVELARLADDDGARADHQDRLDVGAPRHQTRHLVDQVPEPLEEVAGVVRAGTGLGVVLHAEGGNRRAAQPFDHAVVQVDVGHLGRPVGPTSAASRPSTA